MDSVTKMALQISLVNSSLGERLLDAYQFGNPRLKRIAGARITKEHRTLFPSGLVLSLPREGSAGAEFVLGEVKYGSRREEFGLSRNDILQGVGIWGRSGSGKTNVALLLMDSFKKARVSYCFLDHKRTGREILARDSGARVLRPGKGGAAFNPLMTPPGSTPSSYHAQLLDVLMATHRLGHGARHLLENALSRTSSLTADKLEATLMEQSDGLRAGAWKETALRVLRSISPLCNAETSPKSLVNQLLDGRTVIELDGLGIPERTFFSHALLLWLYSSLLEEGAREELRLAVFLEEGHHLAGDNNTGNDFVDVFLRQCRELGIGVITIDQSVSKISQTAVQNNSVSICMSQSSPADERAARAVSGTQDATVFGSLQVGQGVVKLRSRQGAQAPFLVSFNKSSIEKGRVTNQWLETGKRTKSAAESPKKSSSSYQAPGAKNALPGACQAVLEDVRAHPTSPIRGRFERLDLSVYSGSNAVRELSRMGLVRQASVLVGRNRRTALMAIGDGHGPRESALHYFWKYWWKEALEESGFGAAVEVPRLGGRIDVLANRGGFSVGVEVECGKSQILGNAIAGLLSPISHLIAVGTSRGAVNAMRKQYEGAGILTSPRLTVVERDRGSRDLLNWLVTRSTSPPRIP